MKNNSGCLNEIDNERLVELIEAQREFRDLLLSDIHRPTYHFVNPEGRGMPFDPNGAVFWKGKYHLGYIYQGDDRVTPRNNEHRNFDCWGHVSSVDLLHWRFHKTMLAPGMPDQSIFSGNCFINKDGVPTIIYHGVGAGNCIATCNSADLEDWVKLDSNPIIPIPPKNSDTAKLYSSWDPHGWTENGVHYAVFGGPIPALFRAKQLDDWEYVGPFLSRELDEVDGEHEDVSCPKFFQLGQRHVLLCISHERGTRCYIGDWKDDQFHPESHHRLNFPGGTCFAPETLLDDKGRRIMWAWVLDQNEDLHITDFTRPPPKGWSGVMTLPRVLELTRDGNISIKPVSELKALRLRERDYHEVLVKDGQFKALKEASGNTIELLLTAKVTAAQGFGLKVCASPSDEEYTLISYDVINSELVIDFEKSTTDPSIEAKFYTMFFRSTGENPSVKKQVAPLILNENEPLRLRIFLDRSIVEVYANDRQCMTQRIYPTREDSVGIEVFSRGGDTTISRFQVWDIAATNQW